MSNATDPTTQLAEFAALFGRVKERWPDAPGLPDGYYFNALRGVGTVLYFHLPDASTDLVSKPAALALCAVTAMEIGAWWEKRGATARVWHDMFRWVWRVSLNDGSWRDGESDCLHSATLAMLRAIVEVAA